VLPSVLKQISILIARQILHVDLHPGNILVNPADQVFIIDFDKARTSQKNLSKLRNQYISRWRRAALKYNLPETLCNDIGKIKGQEF
jgi:predicted unusual protein kinase regulating ubiquinone biosynthesis (AarF/ABC1/UbiB family)